jgi:hypothetical protein
VANEQNLKPFGSGKLTESEQREIQKKGNKKSAEVRGINAEMRKRLEQIVKMTLREGRADKIKNLADAKGANLTISDALLVKLVTMALSGNIKAMNKLIELIGMDSPAPPEAPQEQSSGFVNALNDSAEEVWANEAPEEE